jgi:hypothetical protein
MVGPSLDRFGMTKIFVIAFFIKRHRLAPFENWTACPVFEWSDIQMPRTGIKSNLKTDHGPDFGC